MEDSKNLLFSVFNGEQEITEAMFNEVKDFVAYVVLQGKD